MRWVLSKRTTLVTAALAFSMLAIAGLSRYRHVICIDGLTPPGIDDTIYAAEYSHDAYCQLPVGASPDTVLQHLGPPLVIDWRYGEFDDLGAQRITFHLKDGVWIVTESVGTEAPVIGLTMEDVQRLIGGPVVELWPYSDRGPSDGNYRVRVLHFRDGVVSEKIGSYYWD